MGGVMEIKEKKETIEGSGVLPALRVTVFLSVHMWLINIQANYFNPLRRFFSVLENFPKMPLWLRC